MAIDVAFDGGSTLTVQPSRMEITEAPAARRQVANGGYIFSPRSKGRVIRLIFGRGEVKAGALTELRSERNSVVAHTLQFNDPDSNAFNLKVGWEADPPYGISTANHIERFVVVLYERPD